MVNIQFILILNTYLFNFIQNLKIQGHFVTRLTYTVVIRVAMQNTNIT